MVATSKTPRYSIILQKVHYFFLILGGVYVFVLVLGVSPFMQKQLLYMHNVKVPLFPRYDLPEKHDLAPFKTHNVRIKTPDNETLGAWFTFSDSFYATHKAHLLALSNTSSESPPSSSDELIRTALRTHPTILFLHGNGGTRVLPSRIQHYQAFASRLRANVFAPDYRGYADSTGAPSEAGLTLDARASWDWLRSHGAALENMLVVGNSLGTAVAVKLASALEAEQQPDGKEVGVSGHERPRGVVLLAPFSSVQMLLDSYYVAGFVPLFAPIRPFPLITNFVKSFLADRFDTLTKVVELSVPLLIVHAENDWDIPHSHSQSLFDAFLDRHLPPLPEIAAAMAGSADEVMEKIDRLSKERRALRRDLVVASEIPRLGRVEVFSKDRSDGKVAFLRTRWGGHSRVGLVEGVQDYMAEMFDMGS